MLRFLVLLLLLVAFSWAAKPMEPLTSYNVIMVHGAADNKNNGFECIDAKKDAWNFLKDYKSNFNEKNDDENKEKFPWQLGNAPGMLGSYDSENKLTHWLDTKIFENVGDIKDRIDSSRIYLQRSFTRPAGSPKDNGREIGYSKWACGERRSLIEEAQEVKAKGRENLSALRENPTERDKLPPSRNILIAHSMGGVASREYVQGYDYNDDVDKVITLDSPHKGTHSLDGLLDAKKYIQNPIKETLTQVLIPVIAFSFLTSNGGPTYDKDRQAIQWFATGIASANGLNAVMDAAVDAFLGYDYTDYDPLVPYIRPGSDALKTLNNKPYNSNLPMMRILSSKNGLTFGSNKEYLQDKISFIVPDAIYVPVKNSVAQISHTEISNPGYFNNIMASILLGMVGGFSLTDHGSALIPHWSGAAENVAALHSSNGDSKYYTYAANKYANNPGVPFLDITAALIAMRIAEELGIFDKPLAEISRMVIAITTAAVLSSFMVPSAVAAGMDLSLGHEMPILKEHQSDWEGEKNSYSLINNGYSTTVTPLRMEEFLYEKPFANIKVRSQYSENWEDMKIDSLGLYLEYSDTTNVDTIKQLKPIPVTLSNPLTFKSSGDWETLAAKKERWKRVGGVGDSVPIRHVDRYPMPSVMVKDFIQKYEFEIDDIMPHRLRQIRLNFNFNEELAWECDVDKAETDETACAVYKRGPSDSGWVKIRDEKHPVKKNGIFEFIPKNYYTTGLGTIQKDNQNAVIISLVNKMGLSNSQRFYYLFKATADLAEPHWPLRGIKISKINDFTAYISALDYQDIEAIGGKEIIVSDTFSGILNYNEMSSPVENGNGYLLKSDYEYKNLADGKYTWQLELETGDLSDSAKSSVSQMSVPFILDTTPPQINLSAERPTVNFDSTVFLARFENTDTTKNDEWLKMVVFFLKKDGNAIAHAKFTNVLAPAFGIALSSFKLQTLADGKYEIAAYAFDGSIGSLDQYNLLNSVANGEKSVYELIDSAKAKTGINYSRASAEFNVDMQAPEIREFSLSRLSMGLYIDKPSYIPSADSGEYVLNQDSLLKISISISDSNSKDSAVARYSILFSERNGGGQMQMGDILLLVNGKGQKEWTETYGALIPDGDYDVSVRVWDEAGNASERVYEEILRIDRHPPAIVQVIASQLTYADTSGDYTATIYVNSEAGMKCYYSINDGEWNMADSTVFKMDKNIVGTATGKRRLRGGCMDWAGNFASILDFFSVGAPSPIITYPSDSAVIENSVIAIRGMAPKRSVNELPASYMLDWRKAGESEWHTDGLDVGAGRRLDSAAWISKSIKPENGDLGFLYLAGFETNSDYELRLSVRDCDSCEWRSDIVSFSYWADNFSSHLDSLNFAVSDSSFVPGEDMLSLSLSVAGSTGDDFRARIYALDSKGTLLDISADTLSVSPFEGEPVSLDGNGIWLWSENEDYNLRWNGLPAGEDIAVHYAYGDIDESVCGAGCTIKDTLIDLNLEDMYKNLPSYVPYETRIPKGLNRAMIFSRSSDSIKFNNKKAFWLKTRDILKDLDSASLLPVRLGKDGSMLDTIVTYSGGVQVNQNLYGLYYKWNGMASTKRYPQGDYATIYAEAVENRHGGRILRDSVKVRIVKPDLRIVSDSDALDDFYVVSYKDSDGTDGEAMALGKKTAYYGVVGRDAKVSAYIKNESGDIVRTLFENNLHLAYMANTYSLSWDGVDNNGHLVLEGNHYFHIVAREDVVSDNSQIDSLSMGFKVSYSPSVVVMKDDSSTTHTSSLSLIYADSLRSDYWKYAPMADYLVKAEAIGKTLPDSLRNFDVEWTAEDGKQKVYGFQPQRFSLGIKRQRETLPLVIVAKANFTLVKEECNLDGTSISNHSVDTTLLHEVIHFRDKISEKFHISFNAYDYGKVGRGFADNAVNTIILYAFLRKDAEGGKSARELISDGKHVWKDTVYLPKVSADNEYEKEERNLVRDIGTDEEDARCTASLDLDSEQKICTYKVRSNGKLNTLSYNPNKNLFKGTAKPINTYFYHDKGKIHKTCSWDDRNRVRKLDTEIELKIPDSYWNAEYGYDNLVNRTIRLDQTNITMYGNEGYLRQVHDSAPSVKDSIFYDGKEWHSNYNYGMLTPFEVHRFPFVPVNTLGSNNAFTFPDEALGYKYPSYYHAKFYNDPNEDIQYRAEIKGQYVSGKTCERLSLWGNCADLSYEYAYDSTTLYSGMESQKTDRLLEHGKVDIYVSMDAKLRDQDLVDSVPYPAKDWAAQDTCPDYSDDSWKGKTAYEADCKKYYPAGSQIHYAIGDFTDKDWEDSMMTSIAGREGKVIANINNSANARSPFDTLGNQSGAVNPCSTSFAMNPSNYNSNEGKFYKTTHCNLSTGLENVSVAYYTPKIKGVEDGIVELRSDTLYINATDWSDSSVWRRLDSLPPPDYPNYNSPVTMQGSSFFNDEWVKELKLTNAELLHLDSTYHTHFEAKAEENNTVSLSVKEPSLITTARPSELIAIEGLVPETSNWKMFYLNRGSLHTINSGNSGGSLYEWFDVNRLQGNTSIILQWGGSDGVFTNMRKLDLDIGKSVNPSDSIVQSLFGEVSVMFPRNSIGDTVVTVRTANADDYHFETSNGTALLGPIVEVLPSMVFEDTTALPRIKARIMKSELNNISPNNVRLYKVDIESGKFVELENTLMGFDVEEPKCQPENYENCGYNNNNWTYLLISAETRTFSVFATLDKDVAEQLNEESDKAPEEPLPTEIACAIPDTPLWLGLDNGYLELPQQCNQPAMGTLQIRQNGDIVAEARQSLPDTLRWDGIVGINKIMYGEYASRYIAQGLTGQEMQTLGPAIYTDTLRPVISNWSVEESSAVLDREYKINANAYDDLSGISSIRLAWMLGDAISDTLLLNADSAGNVDYTLYIPRKQLALCAGCKLNISLRAEDKGHNWAEQQWQSERLWPYPDGLALWYPAQEGGGRTAAEYVGTGHDLNLLMPAPWLSGSGIYFEDGNARAIGNGQVDIGRSDSYTFEAWVNPGHAKDNSAWSRILGFSFADGRRADLQLKGGDVRLLDGTEAWVVPNLLSQKKSWSHLAVSVDGIYARFYMDGQLAGIVAATPSERLWSGIFSLGMNDFAPSFAGHLMQVRLYKRALSEEEVYAIFSGMGLGDGGSRAEIALAGELDWKTDGVGREFSCAVPGSSYWGISKESSVSWKAWADHGAAYRVFLYARSAQPGAKAVKAGVSGSLASGTVVLENVWRPVALQGISLPLRSGFNDIELRLPEGMDIAGIALSDNPSLLPSQISWKSENSVANSPSVAAQVIFEGHPDPSMIRPRIRLQNIGSSTIYGPKARYYFRGEDPAQVQASKYYPQEGELIVRQEGDNLGYAEWSFPETVALPAGQLLFWGEGPHFGLHNTNYVPWVISDDAPEIIVLDSENRLLSGSCFENEHPLNSTPAAQVFARDSRAGDGQASQLYIRLENIGQVPIRDYEVRYSFYVPGNVVPILDVYDMQGLSASLKNLGSGRWQAAISGSYLGPGISWANPAQFALHLPNWQNGWSAAGDPSYEGLSAEWAIAKGIEVFDASGNRIYGKAPAWPAEPAGESGDGELAWGAELLPAPGGVSALDWIARTPEGLMVTMLEGSQLRLDLVNAAGMPQKFIYQGALGAGEHLIPVDWARVNIAQTYLVARLNGKIATQLLSTLGD